MSSTLDDLLTDARLARLFSHEERGCALQLWVLQVESGTDTSNRVIYGRLVPYSYANHAWSATRDDHFTGYGAVRVQLVRLNLYLSSRRCPELLRLLSSGLSLASVSEQLGFDFPPDLKSRFGITALAARGLAYRPTAFLLNRDAHRIRTPSSPHGGAGALSAAVVQVDKEALFRLGAAYDVDLARSVVAQLNDETGMDFDGVDVGRFGDVELLVFPALDDQERQLLNVEWAEDACTVVVRLDPMQLLTFGGFRFRVCLVNDGQVAETRLARAERRADGVFEGRFSFDPQLRARTDSIDLEVFGVADESATDDVLCCRWGASYIREIHIKGKVAGTASNSVRLDWLEKATRPAMAARVKAATIINRGDEGFSSSVGGRGADPWVSANRALATLFARLHPPASDGRFFDRWSQGDGAGRLQFVEWFKTLLTRHKHRQVIIFDPYFEDVGLNLLSLHAEPGADYIVFTSLPRISAADPTAVAEQKPPTPIRIDNLVNSCQLNHHLLSRFKLRIFGLREGRLHDRYVLMMAPDGLPVAGFHLSNSFQKVAENYPLLVTPIPADVLIKVERYAVALVREAEAGAAEYAPSKPALLKLFESQATPPQPRIYESLKFLDRVNAGDVLSVWAERPDLAGLSGATLTAAMTRAGLIKDGSLHLPQAAGLRHGLKLFSDPSLDADDTWEMLSELVAHSPDEGGGSPELASERRFLEQLADYLERAFKRDPVIRDREVTVLQAQLLHKGLGTLLRSSYLPEHLCRATKSQELSWGEYFCIKYLWRYAPSALLKIVEPRMAEVPNEPQGSHAVTLSLIGQVISEIAASVRLGTDERQVEGLLRSGHALLRWLGLNVLTERLESPNGLTDVLPVVADFAPADQVQILGWMVQRAARRPGIESYAGLIAALHNALPSRISEAQLERLVDGMRGHMTRLAWAEPWLFEDVILPLLRAGRADVDDACGIWLAELAVMMEPPPEISLVPAVASLLRPGPRFFTCAREGQTTNVAAFLFAHSSSARRRTSLKLMAVALRRQQRIVHRPLASTSDWTAWNDALEVSLWLLSFTRWVLVHSPVGCKLEPEFERLSASAGAIAARRSMDEWRSSGPGERGALAAFLERGEATLAER